MSLCLKVVDLCMYSFPGCRHRAWSGLMYKLSPVLRWNVGSIAVLIMYQETDCLGSIFQGLGPGVVLKW
jgi:hypothetical protein